MKATRLLSTAISTALLAGCGPQWGFLIKPVPVDQQLQETVIAADPGLFVTDKIAVVDVDGVLLNQRDSGLMGTGENPVSLFVEKIDRARADKNVRAVVLRINSPGGGVTASDIMYERLMRLREARDIPVVAIIEDVGASGGYYLACAADTILAHPTSTVGSIGVIVQTVSLAGTMKMIGVSAKAVTSGPRKDMASPLKPLDEEDLAILQSIVDKYYQRFLDVVTEARTLAPGQAEAGATEARKALTPEKIRALADGRVYAADQALANGLIDGVGYMDAAIALAKELSGAKRVKVVVYARPWGYRPNAYAAAAPADPRTSMQINLLNISAPDLLTLSRPRFLYLWTGKTFGER